MVLVLICGYISLFVVVWLRNKSWKKRGMWWVIILSPLVIWGWDYPIVHHEFVEQCKKEGGLKIFKQPDKVNQLRLEGGLSKFEAEGLLRRFYPQLEVVEATDVHKPGYFDYRVSHAAAPGKSSDWVFSQSSSTAATQNGYVLRAIYDNPFNAPKPKRIIQLERNGEVYARWTAITYVWREGIFGEPIGWDCYRHGSPEQMAYGPLEYDVLVKLLIK